MGLPTLADHQGIQPVLANFCPGVQPSLERDQPQSSKPLTHQLTPNLRDGLRVFRPQLDTPGIGA